MIALTAKRRENSVFPFFGTANDRMPVRIKLNGKRSKFTTLESKKTPKIGTLKKLINERIKNVYS